MNLKFVQALAMIVLLLGLGPGARAMTIENFARMNNDDEAEFITTLVEASSDYLKKKGQPDQAQKAIALFKNYSHDSGVPQLASNLRMMNGINMRNAINPNNRVPQYQVEDAVQRTFHDVGIEVPAPYLLAVGKEFKPSGPPRAHILGP